MPTSVDLVNNSTYDTGSLSTDNITNRDNSTGSKTLQFTVQGTVSGATVKLYANNGSGPVLMGSATASGTSTTITTNGTQDILDGTRTITATQTESGKSESLAVRINIVIDTAISTPTISMASADDTGHSNSDRLTNVARPHFFGVAEAGATISLLDTGGGTIATGVVLSDGTWQLQPTASLTKGTHSIKVRVTDAAGNTVDSTALSVVFEVLGDWDQNGSLTEDDIDAMLDALTDLNAYRSSHGLSTDELLCLGDINASGAITNADIQSMLDLFI